jgi:hypothetical protein
MADDDDRRIWTSSQSKGLYQRSGERIESKLGELHEIKNIKTMFKFDSEAVLWNRKNFSRFRFRFRLLKSYGSGYVSDF